MFDHEILDVSKALVEVGVLAKFLIEEINTNNNHDSSKTFSEQKQIINL